jgi:hypothetical protein
MELVHIVSLDGDKTSEAARFAYVASSRPKHILVWCVKKLNASDQKKLESLGFEVLSCWF